MKGFILEARDISRQFHGFFAVKNANLSVRQGSIHALIGPNGAGKSTMFNLLTKFLRPTAGTIIYEGDDVTALEPESLARRGLVRSFQISAVFPTMSALENVRVALQRRKVGWRELLRPERVLSRLDAEAAGLVEQVGLGDYMHRPAGALSYGRKRALEIATTIALDPKVLLLDEPMAGMAHEDVSRITGLIREVAAGRTVLLVEHNLGVVADLCDRVTVLQRGEVLAEGSYAEVATDPRVRQAYLGTAS